MHHSHGHSCTGVLVQLSPVERSATKSAAFSHSQRYVIVFLSRRAKGVRDLPEPQVTVTVVVLLSDNSRHLGKKGWSGLVWSENHLIFHFIFDWIYTVNFHNFYRSTPGRGAACRTSTALPLPSISCSMRRSFFRLDRPRLILHLRHSSLQVEIQQSFV